MIALVRRLNHIIVTPAQETSGSLHWNKIILKGKYWFNHRCEKSTRGKVLHVKLSSWFLKVFPWSLCRTIYVPCQRRRNCSVSSWQDQRNANLLSRHNALQKYHWVSRKYFLIHYWHPKLTMAKGKNWKPFSLACLAVRKWLSEQNGQVSLSMFPLKMKSLTASFVLVYIVAVLDFKNSHVTIVK